MNILIYFILAHLIGDFVFQPKKLVKWKMKNKVGGLVHALIHFVITTLVLLPFILNNNEWLLALIFLISFTHFWIDEAKINYSLKHDKKIPPFFLDQLVHFVVILASYFLIKHVEVSLPVNDFIYLYTNPEIIFFVFLIVIIGVSYEIYKFHLRT